ncbi:MAG: 16S rRNA (adenine(1518)-N(6)/adenine(1519)-N(6))-dimethyltransferase RsmA [Desulfobacterales bacterium]
MTSPKRLLNAWGLHPRKRLGQNFLADPSIADTIVSRAALLPEDIVFEIGAGLGALTIPIARAVKKVYAVEKDHGIADLLKTELLASKLSNVRIMEEDVLKIDIGERIDADGGKIIVVGNLPYNVSSQILVKLIASRKTIHRAILMFQEEFAQRLTAVEGGRDYGRLSVMLRYCSDIRTITSVRAAAFHPKPRIDSRVIEIRFLDTPQYLATDEAFLFSVIKAAFGKRRKTLKNALSNSTLPIDPATILTALESSGIDPSRRAETLTVQEFVALSDRLLEVERIEVS